MDSELWRRLRLAYDQVLDAPEADRQRLIEELTRTDPELGRELAKLLAAENAPSTSLDTPVVRLVVADLEPGVVLCSRFRLLRRIGHGGMGDVWAARDEKLNEDVAVKTIRADLAQDPQQLSRLKRELLLARRVAHPNVCKVFDLFEHVADPYPVSFLTMELIEGETLADRLAREKTLPFADALRVVRDVADGLAAAHAAGVVHRDLKPANVILTGDESRRTVILDFGLARDPARVESDGATAFGTLVGTPEYMAPEQISGAAVTPATDLYALGLMFFEMLDGTRPFAGVSTPDSWMRRAREGPKPLSGSVDGVRARTDTVIRKCLAYEPSERYQSAGELVGALDGTKLSFLVPDDRRVWLAVAIVILAVLGAGGFATWRRFSPQLPPAEAMKWFEDAQQALAEGASVRALNNVNRAIELAPWFAPSHALLAEVRLELDMPGRAQEAMLKASELARRGQGVPEPYTRYINGMQALILRQCDQAIAEFRAVTSVIDSMHPYRMVSVARAMERCDRPDDAVATLKAAASVDPRNAAVSLGLGRLAARRRDYATAIASLEAAERVFRDRNNVEGVGEALTLRGTYEAAQDRLKEADISLANAARIADGLGDVRQTIRIRLQQAVVNRKRGDVANASDLTAQAIEMGRKYDLEPLTLDGLIAAGNVLLVRNQFEEARVLYERALEIAETHRHEEYEARIHLSLASLYVQILQPEIAEAEIAASRVFYASIDHARNLALLDALSGQVHIAMMRYEVAIRQFRASINEATAVGDTEQEIAGRENLATALASSGSYVDAISEYRHVAALHRAAGRVRGVAFATLNLIDLLTRLGRFEEAAAEPVPSIDPAAAELRAQQKRIEAAVALRRGRWQAARAAALDVMRIGSNLSPERVIRAVLTVCLAETMLSLPSPSACDEAEQRTKGVTHRALLLESLVSLAEARIVAGDKSRTAILLREAETVVHPDTITEHRWRLLAGKALVAGATERKSILDSLNREISVLQRKWGPDNFKSWRRRADVQALIGAPMRGEL